MELFDFFHEHQDCAAGRGDLLARVARQAVTPTPERLELLFIEGWARSIRQGSPTAAEIIFLRYEIRRPRSSPVLRGQAVEQLRVPRPPR
jgi:hypothetical protein